MRATLWRGVVAVGLLLAAGCSGSDDDDATVITNTSATSAAPITEPSTTTTEPTTSTTEDPVAAAEEAAVAAVMEQGRLWRECSSDPPRCDISVFNRTTTGEPLDALTDRLAELRTSGQVALPPLDPDHELRYAVSVEVTNDSATAVRVVVCTVDGRRIVEPGGAPDGSDLIVNDKIVSDLNEAFVRLDGDGSWRIFRVGGLGSAEGGGGCDDLLD